MRKTILAITTVLAASAASPIAAVPAAAYDAPYCLQGRGVGIPGDCSYMTYTACTTAASGRGLYCNINPRVAYGQQQQPRRRAPPRYYYYD